MVNKYEKDRFSVAVSDVLLSDLFRLLVGYGDGSIPSRVEVLNDRDVAKWLNLAPS